MASMAILDVNAAMVSMAILDVNAAIWGELPVEILLFHILPRLPLFYRLNLRSVCRHWNTLLVSKSYMDQCQSLSLFASSFLVIFQLTSCRSVTPCLSATVYDSSAKTWQTLLMPLIPHEIASKFNLQRCIPFVCGGGLLGFGKRVKGRNAIGIVICNPLLNQWLHIPELEIGESLASVLMCPNCNSIFPKEGDRGFILVIYLTNNGIRLFDSTTGSWTVIHHDNRFPCYDCTAVVIKDVVYILATNGANSSELLLLGYDTKSCHHIFCLPTRELGLDVTINGTGFKREQLYECNGQLIMLGWKKGLLCMFMFDMSTLKWTLFRALQGPPWSINRYSRMTDFDVYQSQNLFFFDGGSRYCDIDCDVFDLERNEWKLMSHYPGKARQLFEQILCYQPTCQMLY